MPGARDNIITTGEIDVTVRKLDFVTSFARNWQHLAEILGITRMIEATPGTELTSKYAEGELEDGDVGEGEFIPRSKYEVKEKPYDKLKIEKYSKETTIEAVQKYGFDVAIDMTDDEFQVDIENVVTEKFYTRLQTGTTKYKEKTFQMAFAMAIGAVKNEFKKMHKSVTGVAVWINTLDLYTYLGESNITIQTAFGMQYIENFMGADVVFVTSELPRKKIIATPLNNIVAYHMNPASSEFARMGLDYTVDGESNLVGFAVKGDYDHATSVSYALLGLVLFAEYENGIAIFTIDPAAADNETLSAKEESLVGGP